MKNGLNKFTKGMFAIFTIKIVLFGLIFINQACESNTNELENNAKEDFLSALLESKDLINNISINKPNTENTQARDLNDGTLILDEDIVRLCLDKPIDDTNDGSDNQEGLTLGDIIALDINIIQNNDYNIDETGDYCYEVEEDETIEALNPAIQQAKNYLYTKGFTNQEIDEMIIEENGSEYDLIPLVMAMTSMENSNTASSLNFSDLFITSAYAQEQEQGISLEEVGRCAAIAIGADILWSLGASSASSWTKSAMKKAFGAVAKRLLGPIGVAIAVVSFGICMSEAYFAEA